MVVRTVVSRVLGHSDFGTTADVHAQAWNGAHAGRRWHGPKPGRGMRRGTVPAKKPPEFAPGANSCEKVVGVPRFERGTS